MDLSICILTHSQPELLPQCVASCFSEIHALGIMGEVIIIDNASSDGSPRKAAELFPQVRIIRNEENLGFAAANNKAIRLAAVDNVLVLNDDAVLEPGSLGLMLGELNSNSRIGAVGPKLLNPDGSVQKGYTNRRFPNLRAVVLSFLKLNQILEKTALTRSIFTLERDSERSGETDYLAGACLLARRKALEDVGLFDEGFYFGYEDTDLCLRLKKAGWKIIYVAEATVIHHPSSSFRKLGRSETSAMFLKSLLYYFKKHSSPARFFLLRAMLIWAFSLRLVVSSLLTVFSSDLNRKGRTELVRGSLESLKSLI